ncbi:MAG: helix-turn-helix transcriptional regulator [Bacteroidota bacterium]
MVDFSERLSYIMKLKGLKQADLSRLSGYSGPGIRKVKNGESEPKYGLLKAIIEAYPDLSAFWLLTGKGNPLDGGNRKSLYDYDVREVAERVVREQEVFLEDVLYNEFVEKMALRKLREIEKNN